jgi:hypothetical protein
MSGGTGLIQFEVKDVHDQESPVVQQDHMPAD